MCQNLFLVCACCCFNGFEFDDHFFLDDEIGTESFLELNPMKDNRNGNLSFNLQSLLLKLVRQENLIDALQEARAQFLVKANSAIHNDPANLILGHFFVPSWLCVSPNSSFPKCSTVL
jgi:hypothetical protein